MEIRERFIGAAASERHLAAEMPGRGRSRCHGDCLVGEPIGIVEQAELHVHPAAIEAQRHLARRELECLGDLRHGLHLFASSPEHVGIVPPRVDVGGAALHGALEEALGMHEIVAIGG